MSKLLLYITVSFHLFFNMSTAVLIRNFKVCKKLNNEFCNNNITIHSFCLNISKTLHKVISIPQISFYLCILNSYRFVVKSPDQESSSNWGIVIKTPITPILAK